MTNSFSWIIKQNESQQQPNYYWTLLSFDFPTEKPHEYDRT